MIADVFTKPLQGELYRVLTSGVIGVPPARHRGALEKSHSGAGAKST